MAFLAVGALSAAGGFLSTRLLRGRGGSGAPGGESSAGAPSDGRAACTTRKQPPRGGDDLDARGAAGALAALPYWQPLPGGAANEGDPAPLDALALPPLSPWEAQTQMQRWSLTQALAAHAVEAQQLHLLSALRRSWTQDAGERGAPAPAMHLSVNVNSSAELAAPQLVPAPPVAAAASAAAAEASSAQGGWRAALLRAALRALATVAAWEAGKAALRRRRRESATGLQLLGRVAMRTAHATPLGAALQQRRKRSGGDGGSTHKWGFIVL